MPLHHESRKYTAFLKDTTLYQFCRSPFGIKTSGSASIRALKLALSDDFDDFVTFYVDDILIASENVDEHLYHLDLVLDRLQKHGYTLKLSKSKFLHSEVPFLGYIISASGYKPNPEKLKILLDFESPNNKRELRQFLGI